MPEVAAHSGGGPNRRRRRRGNGGLDVAGSYWIVSEDNGGPGKQVNIFC